LEGILPKFEAVGDIHIHRKREALTTKNGYLALQELKMKY
jgi:hypothetical protein